MNDIFLAHLALKAGNQNYARLEKITSYVDYDVQDLYGPRHRRIALPQ